MKNFLKVVGIFVLLSVAAAIISNYGKQLAVIALGIAGVVLIIWIIDKTTRAKPAASSQPEPENDFPAPADPPASSPAPVRKPLRKMIVKLKGSSYDNDDGTSRQQILADAKEFGDTSAELVPYLYKGLDAIRVDVPGGTVGMIPAEKVDEVMPILDSVVSAELIIESFIGREGTEVYRADILIEYI